MKRIESHYTIFKTPIAILGFIISAGIFYIDINIMGPEVSFTLLYLFPIVMVTWYTGKTAGFMLSVASLSGWIIIQITQNGVDPSSIVFICNALSKLIVFIFIVILLSELRIRLGMEKSNARTDFLTGIFNRKGFMEALDIAVDHAKRTRKAISIAYIDYDDFKSINDTYGHEAGDAALIKLAYTIKSFIRSEDTVGRIGGDEFAVIFRDTNGRAAKSIIKKIQKIFSNQGMNNSRPVSVSAGIGVFYPKKLSAHKMIVSTDRLMYRVKQEGKNGVCTRVFR